MLPSLTLPSLLLLLPPPPPILPPPPPIGLTEELMISQALIFFLSGYDTTASTLAFLYYSLACDQSVQDRLRLEIQTIASDHVSVLLIDYYVIQTIAGDHVSVLLIDYYVIQTNVSVLLIDYYVIQTDVSVLLIDYYVIYNCVL